MDIEILFQKAAAAFHHAHAPYSKFSVGACVYVDGQYFAGCNVENACYAMCQCAEASAIGNMVSHGYKKIEAILIVSDTSHTIWPCGGCLQKISEFCLPTTQVITATLNGERKQVDFMKLYPQQFNAKDLIS
jgi:cytidine deaminase